mmetsp:Transcript_118498/g.369073  ORF Transcript_118498/g.369073 Transcript_118498/m.369073 type:complete len:217 (-) Transcript_118498:99-749(-)
MPKVRHKAGKTHGGGQPQKSQKAEAEGDAEAAKADAGPLKISRGQRKRRERREGFLRKFEFVNSAVRQEERAKDGGALGDLDSLAAAAEEAAREEKATAPEAGEGKKKRPMSRRAQALATEREMSQYQQVIKVEAFQKDPLGALEQHLRNSIKKQRQEIKEREAKARARVALPAGAKAGKRRLPQPTRQAAGTKGVIKTGLKKRAGAKPKKQMEVG